MNKNIKKMVGVALLMAMVVVMQFISGMIPPIGGFSISLVLIPIVIGASVYGISAGALLGATFGTVVYINCVTGADPGGAMVLQASPLLCFLVVMGKGILGGAAAGWVYNLLSKKNSYLAMFAAAVICPVFNTGTFIACMLLFFNDVLTQWAAGSELVGYILTGLVLANFVPELIINVVFSPASVRIKKIIDRK